MLFFLHPEFALICRWQDKNGDISGSGQAWMQFWDGERVYFVLRFLFSLGQKQNRAYLIRPTRLAARQPSDWAQPLNNHIYHSGGLVWSGNQYFCQASSWPHSTVRQIAPQVHGSKSKLLYVIQANVISRYHFLHACLAQKVSWDGCSQSWNLLGPSPPEMIALTRTHKHNLPQEIESRCLNVKLKWDSRAAAPPTLMKMKT